MKILMLGWELPPHNSGGLGVACYCVSKALCNQGTSIDFVVPYSADHPGIDFMNIIPATKVKPGHLYCDAYWHGNMDDEVVDDGHDYGLSGMRSVQKRYSEFVVKLVHDNPPDVIHAHDWLTMEAGVLAKEACGAPLIVHVHATEFDRSGDTTGNPLVHEIEQRALSAADKIIAVSQITKDIIVKNYHISPDKVEVVYNALDLEDLPPHIYDGQTYRYIEDLKKQGYTVVGTITRMTIQKGMRYLVRAAAKALESNDKLIFVLMGVGEERDALVHLTAKLGISDKFVFGYVQGDRRWRDAFQLFDIFVMSSVSEPFGLTALEAAHHDTALLISHQSGVGEILDSVMRFDYWDVEKLARQIVEISKSPELQETMKRNIKHEYSRISWNDSARQCISLYEATMGGGSSE